MAVGPVPKDTDLTSVVPVELVPMMVKLLESDGTSSQSDPFREYRFHTRDGFGPVAVVPTNSSRGLDPPSIFNTRPGLRRVRF